MDKLQMKVQIRKKKLGLLLADARLAASLSPEETAGAMGVDLKEYLRFEKGEAAPSLPQLELASSFLRVPPDYFRGSQAKSKQQPRDPMLIQQKIENRNLAIGLTFHHARTKSNLALDEVARQVSIPVEVMEQFEAGEVSLPLPELEITLPVVGLELGDLAETDEPVQQPNPLQENGFYQDTPPELQEFLSNPANRPYFEIAMKLRDMSAEKLRAIAETLLEISF